MSSLEKQINELTLCILDNFACILSSADIFSKSTFSQKSFNGLGAKSENLSFVAPPGKRNLVAIMAQTHVLGT